MLQHYTGLKRKQQPKINIKLNLTACTLAPVAAQMTRQPNCASVILQAGGA
jgi:hypothetical protein